MRNPGVVFGFHCHTYSNYGGYGTGGYGVPGDYSSPGYYSRPYSGVPAYGVYSVPQYQTVRPYATAPLPSYGTVMPAPVGPAPSPGVSSSGTPLNGELRPGMVLPDGAVVISVGPVKPAAPAPQPAN